MNLLKRIALGFLLVLLVSCKPEEHTNRSDQAGKPIVVMISIDGFRSDYLEKYSPKTLNKLAREGTVASGLIPSFPSLTFPNHVTLVTGKKPGSHGIISNFFYDEKTKKAYQMNDSMAVNDGSWYHGEPLWLVAENSGMLSATCFWVGSEAKIGGKDPTYLRPYKDAAALNNVARSEQVVDWLKLPEAKRPHMIALYFSDVDSAGHKSGPDSPEVAAAIEDIDNGISKIVDYVDQNKLPVQFVVVSDHGMLPIGQQINLSRFADLKDVQTFERGAVTHLYSDDDQKVEEIYKALKASEKNFKVFRRGETPKEWNFTDPTKVGDLTILADPGFYLIKDEGFANLAVSASKATHGWDPKDTPELNGVFIARGPMIVAGKKIAAFENIHVYPLVLSILQLKPKESYDGDLKVLQGILKR